MNDERADQALKARDRGARHVEPATTDTRPRPAGTAVGVRFIDLDRTTRRRYATVDTPVGELLLVSDGQALVGLYFGPDDQDAPLVGPDWIADRAPLASAVEQVLAYLAGGLAVFDLAVATGGTEFQRQVWRALADIPYGHTTSYGRLAARIGRPTASRAVGMANGRNPVSIVLPCHRIIGASGELTGYGGGLHRKRQLLDLERRGVPGKAPRRIEDGTVPGMPSRADEPDLARDDLPWT